MLRSTYPKKKPMEEQYENTLKLESKGDIRLDRDGDQYKHPSAECDINLHRKRFGHTPESIDRERFRNE